MTDRSSLSMSSETPSESKGRKAWRRFMRIAAIVSLVVIAAMLSAAFVVLLVLHRGLPSIASLKNYEPKEVSQVFADHGQVIGEFYDERRIVVKDVPEKVKQAFIAAEDAQFYYHKGIDLFGMARAFYVNMMSGGFRQGASTITQQVVRALLLTPEKTLTRKVREIILAWQIENNLSKDEILHLYLNHIYLGGGYGVAAAARTYFGKELHQISTAEAAVLAGLPQAPSRYSPYRNPDRVKRRQLYVLRQMLKHGFITQEEHDQAANETVWIQPLRDINKTEAPYFVEHIRKYVMDKYGAKTVLENGLRIETTLDLDMSRYAENALRKGLSDLEKRQGYRGPLKSLKPGEMKDYFKDRDFEERDEAGVVSNQELEVSAKEAEGKGQVKMRPPRRLEAGDFLEGLVVQVNDQAGEVFVEYQPGYKARLVMADMKWAHERVKSDDDDHMVRDVSVPSQILHVGDVVIVSVKSLPEKSEDPLEAQLEQDTEVEGALTAIDPRNGFVRAMIGGYDFKRSQFNRAVQAKRQPGSAFKPIIYAAALDLGFTPASILQDSPIIFENAADQDKWRPSNFDHRFVGEVTLRNSLLASRNITTIRLLNEVGLDNVIQYARRLGIESPLTRDFTLGLGTSVVSLQEILQPYIVFATGGYRRRPTMIKRIVDRDGKILEENVLEDFSASQIESTRQEYDELKKEVSADVLSKDLLDSKAEGPVSFLKDVDSESLKKRNVVTSSLKPGQVLSSEASFLMTNLLHENVLYGTGRRAKDFDRPACGKTGTTDDNRDAWFIGFTPQLVAGVWVGYDDLRILGAQETGSRAAVPIWLDFMVKATLPYPKTDFVVPDNIEFARIDPKTGRPAPPSSKSSIFEAFVKGTVPTADEVPKARDSDLYERDQ